MIFSLRKGMLLAALARHYPPRALPCLVLLPGADRYLLAAALAAKLQLQGTAVSYVSFHLGTHEMNGTNTDEQSKVGSADSSTHTLASLPLIP